MTLRKSSPLLLIAMFTVMGALLGAASSHLLIPSAFPQETDSSSSDADDNTQANTNTESFDLDLEQDIEAEIEQEAEQASDNLALTERGGGGGGSDGSSPSFSLQATERSRSVPITGSEIAPLPTINVQCNSDEVVTGGGHAVIDEQGNLIDISPIEEKRQDNGWSATWNAAEPPRILIVYAECLKIVPTGAGE